MDAETTADPTAIPLGVDPTYQRMIGRTYHGNMQFDVPYMSQITDNLWMGGCDPLLVLPPNIKHVISLYPWAQYRTNHTVSSRLEVMMLDSEDQEIDYYTMKRIVSWVRACEVDGPTLVHCQAGLNRSGLVVAAFLLDQGKSGEEAINMLREARSPAVLCNKSFEDWVLSWRLHEFQA